MINNTFVEQLRTITSEQKLIKAFENLFGVLQHNWDDSIYSRAREYLNIAEGCPENHYGFQLGKLSQREMFEYDVAIFLTCNWKPIVERHKEKQKSDDYECMKNTQNCENGFGGYHCENGCTLYPETYHCIGCKDFKLRQECKDEWKQIKNQNQ